MYLIDLLISNIFDPTYYFINTQSFSASTVSSFTTKISIRSLFIIVGVLVAIVMIAIIIIVIGFIGVYFYGIHKRKQMSVNSNSQEMTALPNQPSILTEYENLPVIASSLTEQRDENEYQELSQNPSTMTEYTQRSSHTFISSSTSAEYTTLCANTLEKHGDYD